MQLRSTCRLLLILAKSFHEDSCLLAAYTCPVFEEDVIHYSTTVPWDQRFDVEDISFEDRRRFECCSSLNEDNLALKPSPTQLLMNWRRQMYQCTGDRVRHPGVMQSFVVLSITWALGLGQGMSNEYCRLTSPSPARTVFCHRHWYWCDEGWAFWNTSARVNKRPPSGEPAAR